MTLRKNLSLCLSTFAATVLLAAPCWAEIVLTSEGGFEFDILDATTGAIQDGSDDAYDNCFRLTVNGTEYDADTAGTEDGRYVNMATDEIGDLRVTRHAYVPETGGDYVRYFDVIENTGSDTLTVEVQYDCNFGSDSYASVWDTYTDDTTVDENDFWVGTEDTTGHDPIVATSYFGVGATTSPTSLVSDGDDLDASFDLVLGAGEIGAFILFSFQGDTQDDVRAQAQAVVEDIGAATSDMPSGDLAYVSNWGLSGAPIVRLAPDQDRAVPEGGQLEITVVVEDREGDETTTVWDIDGDGHYDDGTGETVTISAAGLDGPTTMSVGVKSTDSQENSSERRFSIAVENAPPVFSGEQEITLLIGERWSYRPTTTDPGGDDVMVTVEGQPSSMILLAGGGVRWQPNEQDVGQTSVIFRAVDDDDRADVEGDGDAVLDLVLTVSDNLPPEEPRILSPERGVRIDETRPTFEVENPSDPEGDPIRIAFEVDVSDTFTSPIAASGPISAGIGTTEWTVNRELEPGQLYHLRVWAIDSSNGDGPRARSFFFVNMQSGEQDGGGDGGTDGGVDGGEPDSGGSGTVDPGCSCRSGQHSAAGGSLVALLTLLGVLALRRRD